MVFQMRAVSGFFFLVILCCAHAQVYPPPLDLGPVNQYGRSLQRSVRLMADSNPAKKRTVKVLFYGQSITQQAWTQWIGEGLQRRFPNANLVITNLAVGYQSDVLRKPAQVDIPNFYPDVMIFQDYGQEIYYEEIVALARRRTTTDILVQNDHIHLAEDLTEPTDPATPGGLPERALRNYVTLPAIASRYGCELGDVRSYWKKYIADYHLETTDLLHDPVHPNLRGDELMTELLEPYFRVDRAFPSDDWIDAEKNYLIGQDLDWTNDVLRLEFTGNRVDVIAEDSSASPVQVWIDGQRPSELLELYSLTRVDWYPASAWLSILQVQAERPLLDEQWTATVLTSTTNNGIPFFTFAVSGSKTGFDGEGSITNRFVSNSRRVIIGPADWLMVYWAASYYPQLQPLPVGHEIHWKSVFNGRDEFTPTVSDPRLESATTLAQGLANGRHVLELRRIGPTPISAIRIYNPLARPHPANPVPLQVRQINLTADGVTLEVSALGRYLIETSDDCRRWEPVTCPLNQLAITIPVESTRRFFRARQID
jgi:hypothetical protein